MNNLYEITYAVNQTFEIFGDYTEARFDNSDDAENCAREWAAEMADQYLDNQSGDRYPMSVGLANEVEFDREWCGATDADRDNLIDAIMASAIEITRTVFVGDDEIEDNDGQEIAIALIRAIEDGNPNVRWKRDGSPERNLLPVILYKYGYADGAWNHATLSESEDALRMFRRIGVEYPCSARRVVARAHARQERINDIRRPVWVASSRVADAQRALAAAQRELETALAAHAAAEADAAAQVQCVDAYYAQLTQG